MEKITWLLISLIILCWSGGPVGPVFAPGQTTDSFHVVSIKGRFLGPKNKTMEEYDYLESGREYRILPETEIQLSTIDGKKTFEAVGPGVVFIDSSGSVLLNGKALKPKEQQSLLGGVTVAKVPSRDLAGLTLRRLQIVPDQEKRSSIYEVDGYAYLGKKTTLDQARKTALINAKRQALEMTRAYIESNSMVKDGKLQYDLIKGGAEGLSVLEQKDYGLEDNRYHIWIRAEVKYDLKSSESGEEGREQILSPEAPLTVRVWTDQKEYRKGQKVVVNIIGNRDFYARIVNVDSEGSITQLLPNDYRSESRFKGGKLYKVPDTGDRFAIKVMDNYGEEAIVVYAGESPLGQVRMEPAGAGLHAYGGSLGQLGRDTRAIKVVPVSAKPELAAGFYENTWKFTTRR